MKILESNRKHSLTIVVAEDVMIFTKKYSDEVVQGIANITVTNDRLILDQLHLQGAAAGKIGRRKLWNIAKEIGERYGVKEVVIQGGKRTTGRYKGTIPSPIIIKL